MDGLRRLIKRNISSGFATTVLRHVIPLPSFLAVPLIKDMTRPFDHQRSYIHKIKDNRWKGAIIMKDIMNCDDQTAIARLQTADIVIFYLHGGGFRTGHCTMFMDSFIDWIELFKNKYNMDLCIMSIEYGLAPKVSYPYPIHECVNAYKYLTEELGVSPKKVIISGDSAGGCIALETLMGTYTPNLLDNLDMQRMNHSLPIPAGTVLISPVMTHLKTSESWKKYEKIDIISKVYADVVIKEYLRLHERDPEDVAVTRLMNVRKDFDRFLSKHVLMFVGDKEVLRDDMLVVAEAIKHDGKCDITVIRENYVHDWFVIHDLIKKKDRKRLINKYNELFVDFSMNAVLEAQKDITESAIASEVSTLNEKEVDVELSDDSNHIVVKNSSYLKENNDNEKQSLINELSSTKFRSMDTISTIAVENNTVKHATASLKESKFFDNPFKLFQKPTFFKTSKL